jgi:hypothetical protein
MLGSRQKWLGKRNELMAHEDIHIYPLYMRGGDIVSQHSEDWGQMDSRDRGWLGLLAWGVNIPCPALFFPSTSNLYSTWLAVYVKGLRGVAKETGPGGRRAGLSESRGGWWGGWRMLGVKARARTAESSPPFRPLLSGPSKSTMPNRSCTITRVGLSNSRRMTF